MNFFNGIIYNFKGLWLGLKTPKLLFLGLSRFLITFVLTLFLIGFIFVYHQKILSLIWVKPESALIVLWYIVSLLVTFFLIGISLLLAYLISQVFFGVLIMDAMSSITERIVCGHEKEAHSSSSFLKKSIYVIKQEIPRSIIPFLLLFLFTAFSWITPFGIIFTILSTCLSLIFLSWDNTDLAPARRFIPFKERFNFLMRNIGFHLGFGILFLIPILNILMLSFAPVGATLFYIDNFEKSAHKT
ncbi:MAG: EI24 domain-containing protein [Desulfobacterales bacterium]|nr:EI24 domain-containing protein [Desulfobacterales bacterium]